MEIQLIPKNHSISWIPYGKGVHIDASGNGLIINKLPRFTILPYVGATLTTAVSLGIYYSMNRFDPRKRLDPRVMQQDVDFWGDPLAVFNLREANAA